MPTFRRNILPASSGFLIRLYTFIRPRRPQITNTTPWPVVRKRTIPTERPPLIGEASAIFLRIEGVTWSTQRNPAFVNPGFLDRIRYFLEIAPQLSSSEWTPFQTHYFSENLVAPEIEPGISGSVARNSDH
jgi:hypothetical protein